MNKTKKWKRIYMEIIFRLFVHEWRMKIFSSWKFLCVTSVPNIIYDLALDPEAVVQRCFIKKCS